MLLTPIFALSTIFAVGSAKPTQNQFPISLPKFKVSVPITLDQYKHYHFPLPITTTSSYLSTKENLYLDTGTLSTLINTPLFTRKLISVSLDANGTSGSITFGGSSKEIQEEDITWFEAADDRFRLPLYGIALRKGAELVQELGLETWTVKIDFAENAIRLPLPSYMTLVQVTQAWKWWSETRARWYYRVDCDRVELFPELVFGVGEEFVIGGDEYIAEVEEGKCVLAVKKMREEGREVVVGSKAFWGRVAVFDFEGRRIGFGDVARRE